MLLLLHSKKHHHSPKARAVEHTQQAVLLDAVSSHRYLRHEVLQVAVGVVRKEPVWPSVKGLDCTGAMEPACATAIAAAAAHM